MSLINQLETEFGDAITARTATPADVVDEISPQAVAAPKNQEAAQALIKWCGAQNVAFIARGGGSKLDLGAPPSQFDLLISTEHLNQIIEHDVGNATVAAGAGIALSQLNEEVKKHGQFVPLDDAFGEDGVLHPGATLGGAVAANDFGMSRLKYGMPRDLVVGLHAALSDGRYVQAGSKVVKNVSGYDLNKIFTGSFGTLGLITQVTIRLRPQDAAGQSWQSTLASWDEARAAADFILNGAFEPTSLRVVAADGKFYLLARFDGGEAAVQTQIERLSGQLKQSPDKLPESIERELILRAGLPLQNAAGWAQQAQAAGANRVLWDAGAGQVRAVFQTVPDDAVEVVSTLRDAATRANGFVIVEKAPSKFKTPEFVWGAPRAEFALMQRLKTAFDAASVCSPGRFVGGL